MLAPVKVPRGVAMLFSIGQITEESVNSYTEHRTDRFRYSKGDSSYYKEMIDNYMSNLSPLSAVAGETYDYMSTRFISIFGGL